MSSLSEPRRPRLVAQNRKLRHLKGLSLRNLAFAPTHLRTTDDASLNTSPNKRLGVVREAGQLRHASRSSEGLRRDSLKDGLRGSLEDGSLDIPSPEGKPPPGLRPKQARRTSLSLVHANLVARQKSLETLVDGAVGDVFFSLHVAGDAEPVYVSEVRERSANFNFQFFSLADLGPAVSRCCFLTIRLWSKRPKQAKWSFLLEQTVDLRQLYFIGTLMDRHFPPNALIFHLEDGLYSLDFPTRESEPRQAPPIPTSSYNALMKLANLESSIDDAMETQRKITDQINRILDDSPLDAMDLAEEEAALSGKYVATQKRSNKLAEKKRDELRQSLDSRRAAIAAGRAVQAKAEEDIAHNKEQLETSRLLAAETEQQIRGQRRRICSELSDVFTITPIPNAPPLSFQICGLPLPNSTYDAATARAHNEDALSAGLGLVALLTRHLQFYLSHPLPYELFPYGSRSWVRDDISVLAEKQAARRDFPLHLPRGGSTVGQWRFEYGWFLLNKDIEALCASQGLKVVDIRHSLPNLKYLLYVCSAGTDQVPERKKGGVRGLWAGRLKGRMSSLHAGAVDGEDNSSLGSRRDSIDSDVLHQHHQHADALRSAIVGGGDGHAEAVAAPDARSAWGVDSGLSLPFDEGEAKFTLRTKGLRENRAR